MPPVPPVRPKPLMSSFPSNRASGNRSQGEEGPILLVRETHKSPVTLCLPCRAAEGTAPALHPGHALNGVSPPRLRGSRDG